MTNLLYTSANHPLVPPAAQDTRSEIDSLGTGLLASDSGALIARMSRVRIEDNDSNWIEESDATMRENCSISVHHFRTIVFPGRFQLNRSLES